MDEHLAFLEERYQLAVERIRQIKEEHVLPEVWDGYFVALADLLELLDGFRDFVNTEGGATEALQQWKERLQERVLPETNPEYAMKLFGEEYGQLLAAVAREMYSLAALMEAKLFEEVVIRPELFVELYGACVCEWQESGRPASYETLREIVYWYVSDYSDITMERQFRESAEGKQTKDATSSASNILSRGILQDEDWLKASFLWDKALAKRRREVAETLQEKSGVYS